MDMRFIVIIILTVTVAVFALIKNYKESKTDDVEKEIKKVMQKNRQSSTSGSTPRRTEYTTAPVKKAASLPSDAQPRNKRTPANPNKKLLAAVLAMVFISTAAFSVIIFATDYDNDDEQNYYEYEQDYCFYNDSAMPDSYVQAGYNITGDNKIIDINDITLSIEGFYEDSFHGEGRGEPLINFSIENNSEKDVSVSFDIIGVNGSCGESCQRTVKSDGSENIICYIFTGVNLGVKDIIFSHLTVTDEDSGECIYGGTGEEYEKLFRFTTDSDEKLYYDPWDEKPIYDENDVKIYKAGTYLCIENNSKHDYSVNAYGLPENQKTEDTICENMLLPYGYSMNFELSGDYDMFDMDEGRVSFSFDFECKDVPSESFETGRIK